MVKFFVCLGGAFNVVILGQKLLLNFVKMYLNAVIFLWFSLSVAAKKRLINRLIDFFSRFYYISWV